MKIEINPPPLPKASSIFFFIGVLLVAYAFATTDSLGHGTFLSRFSMIVGMGSVMYALLKMRI